MRALVKSELLFDKNVTLEVFIRLYCYCDVQLIEQSMYVHLDLLCVTVSMELKVFICLV